MIGSKTGSARWVWSVKRMCALGCAAAGVALASASCSSASPPPQAFVTATLQSGSSGQCAFSEMTYVSIGTDDSESGALVTGKGGTITCTVSASGSSFHVQANATNGTSSFTINGTLSNTAGATTEQPNIGASFFGDSVDYSSSGNTCTVNFNPGPSETNGIGQMGVFNGRVWGNITCQAVTATNGQQSTCEVLDAEFKFENCGS